MNLGKDLSFDGEGCAVGRQSGPEAPGMPGDSGGAAAAGESPGANDQATGRRRYTAEERLGFVEGYLSGSATAAAYCVEKDISLGSLVNWLKRYEASGAAGLEDRRRRRRRRSQSARHWERRSPEQKREIVEAYERSGLTQADFAKTFGISRKTLIAWLTAYRAGGPKALEPGRPGPKPGTEVTPPRGRIPAAVEAEIVRTKRRFPDFGLRKIRDFLLRFGGVQVSAGGVGAALDRAGIERIPVVEKRRRKPDQVRRFERALPMDLWQTDITSFYLGRESRRVYLVAFIDDRSRYVVSFALAHQQRGDLVIEALRDGIARFGKPKEVLSDQGRQYYAWRGKSEFQKLLHREGIQHVVARAHHPETVGKCERLWATIQKEFWSKVLPETIDEARRRLALYLTHFNHFRPHQGIDGLVPADRFFKAEDAARRTIEKAVGQNALAEALSTKVRRPVFLFGQIGDRQVSLHGERGRVVIQTADGERAEIGLEETQTEESNGDGIDECPRSGDCGEGSDDELDGDDTADAAIEEAPALQDTGASGAEHPRDLGAGERQGEGRGAPHGRGDPRNLGGPDDARRSGGETRHPAGEAPPALPARDLGADRRALEATEVETALGPLPGGSGRGNAAQERVRAPRPRE